jgi:hypothetical protein
MHHFLPDSIYIYFNGIVSNIIQNMPSSEFLSCKVCGQTFDTIESLNEHMKSEKEDVELRNKGVDG